MLKYGAAKDPPSRGKELNAFHAVGATQKFGPAPNLKCFLHAQKAVAK